MATVDQQGTTIANGDTVALAWMDGNKPVLIIGTISGAAQVDRGETYYAVIRDDARFDRDIARAVLTFDATHTDGIALNAVKAGFS